MFSTSCVHLSMHKSIHKSSNIEEMKKLKSSYYAQSNFLLESVFKVQVSVSVGQLLSKNCHFFKLRTVSKTETDTCNLKQ